MTQPQPYEVNPYGYGQAVYSVNEPGPGVAVGLHVNEGGAPVHLVDSLRGGPVPVFFENGPPPGSPEYVAQQVMNQAQSYAAYAAGQRPRGAALARVQAHLLQQ